MISWIKKIESNNKNFQGKNICLLDYQFKIREVFEKKFSTIKNFPDIIVNHNLTYVYGYDRVNLLNTRRDCIKYKNHILFLNIGVNIIGIDYVDLKDVFYDYNEINSTQIFYMFINNQIYNTKFVEDLSLCKDVNYCSIEKSINNNYKITYINNHELVDIKQDIDYEEILDILLNHFDYIVS